MTGRKQQRGFALVMSCLLIALMTAYGSAMMVQSLTEQQSVQRFLRLSAAFQAAEAGLDRALTDFKTNANWTGTSYATTLKGGYDVTVTTLSPTLRQVTVTGHYPSNTTTAYGYQRRQVEGTVQLNSTSVFRFALFGNERVRIKVNDDDDTGDNDQAEGQHDNVVLDSYDSSTGSYDPTNPGQKGDIGTNNTADKSVTLKANVGEGSITVKGQVAVGPNLPNPGTAVEITGNVTVTANPQTVSQSQALALPTVSPPGTCQGKLDLKQGETTTLYESGSPYCFDKITLKDQASIAVEGKVVVYTGELTVQQDSQVNATGKPTQLIVQLTSNKKVKLQDNVLVKAGIYAPQSQAKIKGNVIIYGSVVAKRVKMKHNARVHYDAALGTVGPLTGSSSPQLVSWREL